MSFSWQDRPCLVTGGAGFGGSHLAIELVRRKARVHVLDRVFPSNSYLAIEGMTGRINFIQGDVRDQELVKLTIARHGIDTIFHLAAQPIVPISNVMPFETLDTNVAGTYSILEAMRTTQSCKSMVFASSGGYYGATTSDRPIHEDDLPCPAGNMYGASKTAADVVARAYAQVFGLNVATCRFMNTFGPGDPNFSRIVPRALQNLINGSEFNFGDRDDGATRLDFLFIRDMTRAYLSVAENIQKVRGEAFNFGSGRPTSTSDIARLASRIFDGRTRTPIFSGAPRTTPIVKYLDIQKAQSLLQWRPSTSLEDGLAETVDWYRQHISKF